VVLVIVRVEQYIDMLFRCNFFQEGLIGSRVDEYLDLVIDEEGIAVRVTRPGRAGYKHDASESPDVHG
jgi:hypothetical protein